eukprot:jgi/Ulvmu1/8190/UM040_0087.1
MQALTIEDKLFQSEACVSVKAEERRQQQLSFSVPPSDEAGKVRARIEWLLGKRAYTRKRLEDKMLYKGFSPEAVTWALDCVEAWGILSDESYARDYARSRWRLQRWGLKRISYELSSRGVAAEVIERVLLWLRTEGQAERQHDGSYSDAPDADAAGELMHEQLVATARVRLRQMGALPPDKQRRRIAGWLARGGHGWDTAGTVLEELGLR